MSSGIVHKTSYTVHNRIKLIRGGSDYFQLLEDLIDGADDTIHLRAYIFDNDNTGAGIAEALIRAAHRGVRVYVVTDGYASQNLSRTFIRKLRHNGILFKFFEPLFRSTHLYFGRRMHEKVFVADGQHALVGGINISDRYNDVDSIPAWLDYALYANGDIGRQLHTFCASYWKAENAKFTDGKDPVPFHPPEHANGLCSVRMRLNDWVKGKHQVWKTYFNLFNHADESITIMCSYFLPGSVLRNRLSKAAKRGVRVKVILAGPSDVMLAKYAERYLYNWMLKNGIEVYEYQPTVLHAKMMVVDNHWVTIGSFNVNNISAYASMELNLDVRNKTFAASVQKELDTIIANDCIRVTEKNFISNATFFKRLLHKSSYELIRVVLNLSTSYFKHE
jgi:cardiolipin synthase A/B